MWLYKNNVGDIKLTWNGSNKDTFSLYQDNNPICTCPIKERRESICSYRNQSDNGYFLDYFYKVRRKCKMVMFKNSCAPVECSVWYWASGVLSCIVLGFEILFD